MCDDPKSVPPAEQRKPFYEIRVLCERPFFSVSHKRRNTLRRYERDKLFLEVTAFSEEGVATIEDAEILMYIGTELFGSLMKDPSSRELTFKRCDLLRRLQRKPGGKQYAALKGGLIRLAETQITTNIGPNGCQTEPMTFRFLDSQEMNSSGRHITVRVSEWVAQALTGKDVLSIPGYYFDLRAKLDRALFRIARKHVGQQRQASILMGLKTLREKMGATTRQDAFTHDIKAIVERDPLPEYQLTWIHDPVGRKHKIRMALRIIPNPISPDDYDLSDFCIPSGSD